MRDKIYKGDGYDIINEEAESAINNENTVMFYPYLNGPSSPDFYPESQGCFYGINLSTERGNFAAAVMEGIAFQIRILLEEMDAYRNVDKIILFGGGVKGKLWCQIIADVTGLEIMVPSTFEAACAGAAILASRATGEELQQLNCTKSFKPSNKKSMYDEKYKIYRKIEKKLWAQQEVR